MKIKLIAPHEQREDNISSAETFKIPNWWLQGYAPDTLLFQPKGMTAQELIEGFTRLNRQTYSYGSITKRFFGINPWKRNLFGSPVFAGSNFATRKRYFKGLTTPQPFTNTVDLITRRSISGANPAS